ncbi:MAG TPA: TolC family protein [Bryobacteraceae bacterium]|nr:TolC family protein [Bryobacteraceae bacterium]
MFERSLDKARIDHQLAIANGSADPTFSVDASHQPPPLNTYVGASISLPLRIFDRNQGDKLETLLDIGRNEKLRDAARLTALHDVDSAYATLESALKLLRPYKAEYLEEAQNIRSAVSFAYLHGGASLLDFLDAQKEYRDTELSYLNLVGAYLSAANQLNFAVGHEVIR